MVLHRGLTWGSPTVGGRATPLCFSKSLEVDIMGIMFLKVKTKMDWKMDLRWRVVGKLEK